MVVTAAGSAQYGQPARGADDHQFTTELVKTGLYVISGEAGNSVLRLSANGLILVDAKLPVDYDGLRARIRKLSNQPVRVLILTEHCGSGVGTAAKFIENGARIIAQEKVCQNTPHSSLADGKIEHPTLTYDNEYLLKMGGVEAQLMHFGNARTNGDTIVYFPNLKVVAVGDLYASTPNPDFSRGGSLVDWGQVLTEVLKLDFDFVVPGTGPTVSRGDLEAFKTKIDTLVSRATGLIQKGVPKDQFMSQLNTDDLGWHFNFTPTQVDRFYAELSQTERGQSVVSGADAQQTLSQLSGWHAAEPGQSVPTIAVTQ
jgi:glyoxylase-like metal-dependent hydrolase (beta-lactamase superfamily II)